MISFTHLELTLYLSLFCAIWYALGRLTAPRPSLLPLKGTPKEVMRALGPHITSLLPPKTHFVIITVADSLNNEDILLQVGRNVEPEGAIAYLQLATTSLSEKFPSKENPPPLTLQEMMPSAKLHSRATRVHHPD